MKLYNLVPMLYTEDVEATIQFYTSQLGFVCDAFDEVTKWASIHRDGVELILTKPNDMVPFNKAEFTGSFYIRTVNVDTLWQTVKDHVEVCYPIDNFQCSMREFAIYDNNGYVLQFGEELTLN
ncbi:VOC family protein [Mangrovimonas sp. TPBH4]|uniref:VOC family protein n=1 Tax=Mangrovimonas sp. TPBH4 TaxID=1645914 RepID=UPI0012FA0F58|nr:VOC family protein [Mangrovimonas sp. TPBH4]